MITASHIFTSIFKFMWQKYSLIVPKCGTMRLMYGNFYEITAD